MAKIKESCLHGNVRERDKKLYAAIKNGSVPMNFTRVGNIRRSCCEMILNWMKTEFYEWIEHNNDNDNENAYSFKSLCLSFVAIWRCCVYFCLFFPSFSFVTGFAMRNPNRNAIMSNAICMLNVIVNSIWIHIYLPFDLLNV